jgi:hypothetical protein
MIKIIQLFELPIVCGALLKARSCLFGLSFFYPFKKSQYADCEKDEQKDSPSSLWMASGGSKTLSTLSVGQFF